MATVEVGGVTLAYDVVGEGPPLLLVAGCGQPAVAWHLGLAPALVAAGFCVATFDNRGVEPSSSPPAPYRVEEMTADAFGLLDHLGWDEGVLLAGHSMGGWIAEVALRDQPERFAAAALMGSANVPTAWEVALTTVERDLARDVPDLPPLFYAVETLRYLPTADLQDHEVVTEWLAMLEQAPIWANPGRLGQYEACLAWSTAPVRPVDWSSLHLPCLVVAFEHDTDSPPALARAAADALPSGRYVEVGGAGHLGILTHAGEVAAHLVEFFSAHIARGGPPTSRPSPPG
jgi:pimeloyl-ACP methyl ester carboxylesterase